MKKLILICILGVMVTSCKKEYVCECTQYYSGGIDINVNQTTVKGTPSEAVKKCEDKSIAPTTQYVMYSNCSLK